MANQRTRSPRSTRTRPKLKRLGVTSAIKAPRAPASGRPVRPAPSVGAPSWALSSVFHRAKVAAWSGLTKPLRLELIYPAELPFIKALFLDAENVASWTDVIHPIDKARVLKFFDDIKKVTTPLSIDYRVVDGQGSALWVRHVVEHTAGIQPNVSIRGFVEDIQAEKEFQLESLRVSEREQNRIGQDLHDDLCQVLAGLSCLMRVIEGRIAAKAPEELDNLRELNQQIIDAMHRTRALTHGLFPGKTQISDIRGALLELASQVKARFNVRINTEFAGRFPKHTTAQIIQIYRISQEAMTNAIKHGRATEIDVRLEAKTNEMELTVRDNGTGFPKTDSTAPGVGLNIMKYRANMLGGEIAVHDRAPKGALVQLHYPFETS